ncbi:MAG: cell division protein FtsZ, partial [Pseudomonadota bacterium]
RITVIGVGGAGGNAVNNMITSNLEGVEFLVANTDAQALEGTQAERKLQLGVAITQGLGAGSRPEIGRAAAEEAMEQLVNYLDGSHMVFITAGMGGGTGTGAAPVIARAAREMGMLTIGVVTKPFQFEGAHRMRIAEEGLKELQEYVDTLIVIPNQNLFRIATEKTTFADAFTMADEVLHAGVRGVTDLMVMPGMINLDFADIKTVMGEMGKAMMGTGEADGERRSILAAEAAISNPLLEDVSMKGAHGVLINITGDMDTTLYEVDEAVNRIREEVDENANIIFGHTFDENLTGCIRVSVVATGIDLEQVTHGEPKGRRFTLVSERDEQPSLESDGDGGGDSAPVDAPPAPAPAVAQASADLVAATASVSAAQPVSATRAQSLASQPVGMTHGNAAKKMEMTPQPEEEAEPYIPPRPVSVPKAPPLSAPSESVTRTASAEKPASAGLADRVRRGSGTLVGRVMHSLGIDEEEATNVTPSPEKEQPKAQASAPVEPVQQQRFSGFDIPNRGPLPPADDSDMEIPAFLRRQAN